MEEQNLLFENYLLGELSKTETSEFEHRLETDNNFKDEFNLYLKMSAFLEHKIGNEVNNEAFKNNLEKVSDSYFKEKTTKKRKKISPWYYSAAASILLLVSVYFYNSNATPTYADFVAYESIELATRSNYSEQLIKAEKAFNNKNYKEASIYFSKILENNPENIEIKLYNSFALLENNQFTKADRILQKITEGNSVFKDKATWYLALSKLKQKEYAISKAVLKTISKDAAEYTKAQKLLSKLN